jgi:hypothetical protein
MQGIVSQCFIHHHLSSDNDQQFEIIYQNHYQYLLILMSHNSAETGRVHLQYHFNTQTYERDVFLTDVKYLKKATIAIRLNACQLFYKCAISVNLLMEQI